MKTRHILFLIVAVAIIIALASTSPSGNPATVDEITLAYLNHVPKNERDAIVCDGKQIDARDYVNCWRNTAGGYAHAGLWLVEHSGTGNEFTALNGKALAALDHLQSLPNFKKPHLPMANGIDIPRVVAEFDKLRR